jgi:hypothetical protein
MISDLSRNRRLKSVMVRVWWPKLIRKPKLRLAKPSLKMPQKPSSSTVFTITLVFVLFVFGGGIWDIVFRSQLRSMGATSSNQVVLVYPSLDYQYLLEGVVASVFIFTGFIGLMIMHQSTRHVYRPSYARLLLVLGAILVVASYALMVVMLSQKISGG